VTTGPKAASLHGLVNPVDVTPAFAIPLFQREGGGNDLLAQIIGRDGRVENFTPIEIGLYQVNHDVEPVRLEVGQPALWAFQWDAARWLVTTREALSDELLRFSASADLTPLLRLAIARFVPRAGDTDALVRKAFEHLFQYSPESAALWRDLIILLPAARAALRSELPSRSRAALRAADDVTLVCEGPSLRLGVSRPILAAFDDDRQHLLAALSPIRPLAGAFDIDRFEIVENSDRRARELASDPSDAPRPLVTLVPLSRIGRSMATAAGHHSRLRTVGIESLSPDIASKLSPDIDARAGDLFIILLPDEADELADAERLASSLVGRGCLPAAIVVRSYHPAPPPGSDSAASERRFDQLARTARWVAVIGGPQTGGHALQPLVDGADPSRNSPTHIGKWLVRAFLAAAQDQQAGREPLDLAFKRGRGPKFAVPGVGSATGRGAVRTAVEAAYASARASLLDPETARSIAAFLIRGHTAESDARQQCLDQIKSRARHESAVSLYETVLPTLKNRVYVVLLARGFSSDSISWTPRADMGKLRDHGWSYTRLREQGENLDLEIWKDAAEFGVMDLDRRLTTTAEIEEITSGMPMYRGPVVLMFEQLPDIKIRNQLLLHGVIAASIDRLDLLDNLSRQPLRTIVSRLLRAKAGDVLKAMAVFVRDQLMRLLWQEEPGVSVWDQSPTRDETFEIEGWLTETEPFEGRLEPFELDGRGPGRVVFFSGVLRITPAETKAGYPVAFGFKIAIDDHGLRLREPMRFLGAEVQSGDTQLKLDL
jgi:hypothetical protein